MTRTTDIQIAEWRKWIYRHHFADGNGNEPQGNGALSLLDIVIAEQDRADELHKSLDFMRGRKDAAIRRENEWHRQGADAASRIAKVREVIGIDSWASPDTHEGREYLLGYDVIRNRVRRALEGE